MAHSDGIPYSIFEKQPCIFSFYTASAAGTGTVFAAAGNASLPGVIALQKPCQFRLMRSFIASRPDEAVFQSSSYRIEYSV